MIAQGQAPEAALAVVLEDLADKQPPKHYGPEAQTRWLMRETEAANRKAVDTYRGWSCDPKRAQVLCLSCAFGEEEPLLLWPDDTERPALLELLRLLEERKPRRIVAWRGASFDFPFLWERSVGYGGELLRLARWFSRPHYSYIRALRLPDPPAVLVDPCELWETVRGTTKAGASVREFLRVDIDNPISGADVLDRMIAGDREAVAEHVLADAREIREVWRRMAPALGVVG